MVTDDLEALGLCSGSATLFWLVVREHVDASPEGLQKSRWIYPDMSGYCPDIRISRGWMSGYLDIWISRGLDMSGYVRICLDTLVLTP